MSRSRPVGSGQLKTGKLTIIEMWIKMAGNMVLGIGSHGPLNQA